MANAIVCLSDHFFPPEVVLIADGIAYWCYQCGRSNNSWHWYLKLLRVGTRYFIQSHNQAIRAGSTFTQYTVIGPDHEAMWYFCSSMKYRSSLLDYFLTTYVGGPQDPKLMIKEFPLPSQQVTLLNRMPESCSFSLVLPFYFFA